MRYRIYFCCICVLVAYGSFAVLRALWERVTMHQASQNDKLFHGVRKCRQLENVPWARKNGEPYKPSLGDIMVSEKICFGTNYLKPWEWHHVAVAIPNPDEAVSEMEWLQVNREGVKVLECSKLYFPKCKFFVRRLNIKDPQRKADIAERLNDFSRIFWYQEKPYYAGFLYYRYWLGLIPRFLTRNQHQDFENQPGWFCSELVAAAYMHAGLLPMADPKTYWPKTLLYGKLEISEGAELSDPFEITPQ